MKTLQVSEFIEIVNGVLRETLSGESFSIEGEVSGYRVSQGQWVSFDLKDEKGLLNIFLPIWNLHVLVEDGMRVRIFGMPRIYPKYGKFSISAERIEPAGEGAIKKALAALHVRLEKEGIFDSDRKRPLPRFPTRIALVASRESAAYGDVIRILSERWGGLEIDLYHVLVQGERAPAEIVDAISQAQDGEYDVLVMTRGGGSLEDLMAFNDESVARAVRGSRIPTLVAIGHERDITLAEEAADVRGSTPTDCARRLVPDRKDVLYELATAINTVEADFFAQLEEQHALIDRAITWPGLWIAERRVHSEAAADRITTAASSWIRGLNDRLQTHLRLLTSLDPNAVLARGYAILKDDAGRGVTSVGRLQNGQNVCVVLCDGEAELIVDRIEKRSI